MIKLGNIFGSQLVYSEGDKKGEDSRNLAYLKCINIDGNKVTFKVIKCDSNKNLIDDIITTTKYSIKNSLRHFKVSESIEDWNDYDGDNIVYKEITKKIEVPKYKDRVVHKHTYIEKYNNTFIDRLYHGYCRLLKRDFEEEYTEEKIMEI